MHLVVIYDSSCLPLNGLISWWGNVRNVKVMKGSLTESKKKFVTHVADMKPCAQLFPRGAFAMPMLKVEGARSQEMVLNRASAKSKSLGQSSQSVPSRKNPAKTRATSFARGSTSSDQTKELDLPALWLSLLSVALSKCTLRSTSQSLSLDESCMVFVGINSKWLILIQS